ncbi:DNA translocase FtsK 4TM domain-containing protein [Klenkia terrae]|uniref:DNA translocase FtsK 4TM domain-containing protein n=1 Tax=Klenkia terrae TaxID=1052259 RepID=UPI001CD86209|nr:DNA translocase FtsK 4TM domain-containing protein [Klenkia terrae]
MPARSTTSNRRPAAGGTSRSRPATTAAKKKAPAKRAPAKRGATTAARRPAPKRRSVGAGLWGAASGTWSLLARGAGGLARSVARPDETEPLAPEHRRDGVGLAVLGLAIVLGVTAYVGDVGPVGSGIVGAFRWAFGALTYLLPVVLLLAALRLLRHGPRPEARGRLIIGWICVVLPVLGIAHLVTGSPTGEDRDGGGGTVGWAIGNPVGAGVGTAVGVALFLLVVFFGVLVVTATPVHQVPERLRGFLDRVTGRGEDEYDDEEYEDDEFVPDLGLDADPPAPRSTRRSRAQAAMAALQSGADSAETGSSTPGTSTAPATRWPSSRPPAPSCAACPWSTAPCASPSRSCRRSPSPSRWSSSRWRATTSCRR